MRYFIYTLSFFLIEFCSCNSPDKLLETTSTVSETANSSQISTNLICEDPYFDQAFHEMQEMLDGHRDLDFKRSAFLIEWAYEQAELNYSLFTQEISRIAFEVESFVEAKGLGHYRTARNYALFEFFTKPHPMNGYQPYTYDFDDFYGEIDYRNVFVTNLLRTHQGQCRSMPMLYKILSDEIGADSYLTLGPNHLFIKHLDEDGKWVNIELTNGHFATDSWMISSMDISAESIRNGVYMKELSLEESVAFCLVELALAYTHKYDYDSRSIAACNKALEYFPNCISALMHKANTLSQMGKAYIEKQGPELTPFLEKNYAEYQAVEAKMITLGFREMTPDKYAAWVRSMEEERAIKRFAAP